MPSHFHSAANSGEVMRPIVGLLQGMGQHHRAERHGIARLGLGAAALHPGEEVLVGRGEPWPEKLDIVGRPVAQRGDGGLGEARRGADAHRAGDELEERPAARSRRARRGGAPARPEDRSSRCGSAPRRPRRWRANGSCPAAPATSARRSQRGRRHSRRTARTGRGRCARRSRARIRPGLALRKESAPVIAARAQPRSGSGVSRK